MRIASDATAGINLIRSYTSAEIVINDTTVNMSVGVSATDLIRLPELMSISDLALVHAEAILRTDPEVVLLGTGARQIFPASDWASRFLMRSVGLEVMTTPAACRTYNVLASEQRRVTALLIVGPC